MPDVEIHEALLAVRDLGLGDQSLIAVDARCRADLQDEIEREHRRSQPRIRRRVPRVVVVPLSVLLLGTVGAVGYAALTSSSTASAGIDCHLGTTLTGSGTITPLDGRSATETCAQLWSTGALRAGVNTAPAPLHACVDPSATGPIHVFASSDSAICASVGLREDPTAGADAVSANYGRFARALNSQLDSPAYACPTSARLHDLVDEELHVHGLTDWTIADAGTYTQAQPCAAMALDSDTRTVTLSPVGR